jgi:hypothetical protein
MGEAQGGTGDAAGKDACYFKAGWLRRPPRRGPTMTPAPQARDSTPAHLAWFVSSVISLR